MPVVGEEAVEKDPGLLDLIARPGGACWIVDPLDGTANFAAGEDLRHDRLRWCMADTVAVARLDPRRAARAAGRGAEGQGVTLDGAPVQRAKPARPPIGFVGYKVKKEFDRQLRRGQRSRWAASRR